MNKKKRSCFLITPIGKPSSTERNRSDWILEYLARPALGKKYDIVRADQIAKPGSITDQLIQMVVSCDLVVADLTGLNPNVIYELGIRHTVNRPTVQIMDEKEKLPFDLYGERTIFFSHDNVKSINRAVKDLQSFVSETERESFKSTSPVSRAMNVVHLLERSSESGEQLAVILQEIINLKQLNDSIASDQSSLEVTVDSIESEVSDIKESLETLAPHRVAEGGYPGLYIDDSRLIRLFEDVELLLRRALRR